MIYHLMLHPDRGLRVNPLIIRLQRSPLLRVNLQYHSMCNIHLIVHHLLDERGIVGVAGQQDDVQLEPVLPLGDSVCQVAENEFEVF